MSDWVVYCDESRHDDMKSPFLGIGGLWVPQEKKTALIKSLRAIYARHRLSAEVKWSKVSNLKLAAYRELIDFFVAEPDLRFRIILVERADLNHAAFNDDDPELGFYKFYYEMLIKWMVPPDNYLILIDTKKNTGADRFGDLRTRLEAQLRGGAPNPGDKAATLRDLTIIDSAQSPLAQLADLLTGCVTARWCAPASIPSERPKGQLARHLETRTGIDLSKPSPSAAVGKMNLFRITLRKATPPLKPPHAAR